MSGAVQSAADGDDAFAPISEVTLEDRVAFLMERASNYFILQSRVTELENAVATRDRELTEVFSHFNTVMQQLFRNQELLEWKIGGLFHAMDPESYPPPGPNPTIAADAELNKGEEPPIETSGKTT